MGNKRADVPAVRLASARQEGSAASWRSRRGAHFWDTHLEARCQVQSRDLKRERDPDRSLYGSCRWRFGRRRRLHGTVWAGAVNYLSPPFVEQFPAELCECRH
jgi:hypothetical protein